VYDVLLCVTHALTYADHARIHTLDMKSQSRQRRVAIGLARRRCAPRWHQRLATHCNNRGITRTETNIHARTHVDAASLSVSIVLVAAVVAVVAVLAVVAAAILNVLASPIGALVGTAIDAVVAAVAVVGVALVVVYSEAKFACTRTRNESLTAAADATMPPSPPTVDTDADTLSVAPALADLRARSRSRFANRRSSRDGISSSPPSLAMMCAISASLLVSLRAAAAAPRVV
jgi:hypothetical protein